jgi:hypothetical protein
MSYQPVMRPWKPEIYSLGSRSRYAQYPTFVRTSIPGAGFNRQLVMASQPLMLNGMGALGSPLDPMAIVNTTAGLLTNPDATLRQRGPEIVRAVDAHVMAPLVESVVKNAKPYILKYVLPVYAVITVGAVLGAVYGYKISKKVGA